MFGGVLGLLDLLEGGCDNRVEPSQRHEGSADSVFVLRIWRHAGEHIFDNVEAVCEALGLRARWISTDF